MFPDSDEELRPYIFLIAMARLLKGPTLDQIKTYLKGKPDRVIDAVEERLRELVNLGPLEEKDGRYFITIGGEFFLKDQMPEPMKQWAYVRETLISFLKIDGATMEGLAQRFGAGENDLLFRDLVHLFVSNGTLERRAGRYFVSEQAKKDYQLNDLH